MIRFFTKQLLLISFLLSTLVLGAKEFDTRFRVGVKVKTDITKKLDASFEIQYRLHNNLMNFDKGLIEPTLNYRFTKKWDAGMSYRLMATQNRYGNISRQQRGNIFLKYRNNFLDDFKLKARVGLQYGFDDFSNSIFDNDNKLINRNLVEVEYGIFATPLSPFVYYEFFYHINYPQGSVINQWRIGLGLNFELTKKSKIVGAYILNNDLINPETNDAHIFKIIFSYKI